MERRLVMKVDQQKEGAIYAALSYMMWELCRFTGSSFRESVQ